LTLTEQIIEYLKNNPGARPSDIANALGVSVNLVRRILMRLRNRGIVMRIGMGYVVRSEALPTQKAHEESVVESEAVEHEEKPAMVSVKQVSTGAEAPRIGATGTDVEELRVRVEKLENLVKDLMRRIDEIRNSVEKLIVALQSRADHQRIPTEEVLEEILRICGFIEVEKLERLAKMLGIEAKLRNAVEVGGYYVSTEFIKELSKELERFGADALSPRKRALLQLLEELGFVVRNEDGSLKLLDEYFELDTE